MPSYRELLARFRQLSVVVVGDVCLDRYVLGSPTRLSREAPIAVLDWKDEYYLPGEASNPALNLAFLGCTTHLVGVTGADEAAGDLRDLLEHRGTCTNHLVTDPGRRTTEKTRILAQGHLFLPQQLARIDRTDSLPLSRAQEQQLSNSVGELMSDADAVLLSDYKRGVVGPLLIERVRELAGQNGKLTTVDSQGDLYRFSGYGCVRCNQAEMEAVLRRRLVHEEDFEQGLRELAGSVGCEQLVVTRGGDGISYYSRTEGYGHVPGVPVPVVDAVGAGDTVIAVLTLALAAGAKLNIAAHVANQAAALVVQHVGNAYPRAEELLAVLEPHDAMRVGSQ